MKKKFMSLFLIFIVTGCNASYNLDVNNKITENLIINIPTSLSENKLKEIDNKIIKLKPTIDDFDNEYNFQIDTRENNYNKIYNLKYTYDNYNESALATRCFENFNFTENDSYYVLRASGYFGCLYDNENIKINIKTNKYVSKNNADKINKNTYTWNINKKNRTKTDINITIMKNITDSKPTSSKIFKNIFKVGMILVLVIGAIYLYLQYDKKKENP